ncbi:N-acetyltransferase family protein [Frateuria aurantia]
MSPTATSPVQLIECDEAAHAAAIMAIFNEAILHSTALYEYVPRSPERISAWFATKRSGGFPVLGVVDAGGQLLGFASWGPFRAFPAYKYTMEHSVYIRDDQRGRGLGQLLLQQLIARAEDEGVHVLVGCIDADNAASIRLHQRLGFVHAGTFPQVGFKFGRWLDAAFYQRSLAGPAQPQDG